MLYAVDTKSGLEHAVAAAGSVHLVRRGHDCRVPVGFRMLAVTQQFALYMFIVVLVAHKVEVRALSIVRTFIDTVTQRLGLGPVRMVQRVPVKMLIPPVALAPPPRLACTGYQNLCNRKHPVRRGHEIETTIGVLVLAATR